MAAPAQAISPTGRAPASGRWLYGPRTDLLLGAGVGYALSVPLLALWSASSGMHAWPTAVVAALSLFVSGPHYGATILRVYEHRDDRRRYAFFAVWSTLAICAVFVLGLHDALVASALITLYATWSPWHFSGQNYGVALMFLRRRGVPIPPLVKRLLYASFVLSFLLWILILHGEDKAVGIGWLPGTASAVSSYQFRSLGISQGIVAALLPPLGIAYALAITAALGLLLRQARPRDVAPAACTILLQATWYAVPAVLAVVADRPLEGLAFAVIWISAAHAAQYLWVTSYYAKREDPQHRLGPYLVRALLAGSAVTILPGLLFAPQLLGTLPWDAGLAILLISVVNLHHFMLDGAIWKLRDGRVARLLLRSEPEGGADAGRARPLGGFRPAMAVAGVLALAVAATDVWQREFVANRTRDPSRLASAASWLAWIGRDSPQLHAYRGRTLARNGQAEAATAAFQRSLALHPTAEAWAGLGQVWLRRGRPDLARQALEEARVLAPGNEQIAELLQRVGGARAAR